MYIGNLAAASNRADWKFQVELINPDTDLGVDLTGSTIKIALRPDSQTSPLLQGTNSDGHITVTAPATAGIFIVQFSPAEMSILTAGSYDVGMTIKLADGITYPVIAASLPVIDNVVSA
jgi:hypothetical protein